MDESTLLPSVVAALGAYVAEDAKALANTVGQKAYEKCKDLAATVWDKLRGNPKHDMIIQEFQQEPDTWQGPLQKILEKTCERNAEWVEELQGLLNAYEQEKRNFTATIYGDHGNIAQGEQVSNVSAQEMTAENIANQQYFYDQRKYYAKDTEPEGDPSSLEEAEAAFRKWVLDKYQYLQFRGFGLTDKLPLRLRLQDLYVSGKARIELPEGERAGCEGLELAGRKLDRQQGAEPHLSNEPVSLDELIQNEDGLVILGDPGAGKTTYLKKISLEMAQSTDAPLPLLLPLSEYARTLENQSKRVPLTEFILTYLAGCLDPSKLPIAEMAQACLDQDRAVILLDGLDEVRDGALRDYVMDQVTNFYCLFRGRCPFIMTSRIIGYKAIRRVVEGLGECTIVDFDDNDISSFVDKWTRVVEEQVLGEGDHARQRAEQERCELLHAVSDHEGVRRLAGNPLLLTILALMKRQGVVLPRRRAQLYDKYMETLITSWNRVRGLGRGFSGELELNPTLEVLAPLAFRMHEKSAGVGLVDEAELMGMLTRIQEERGQSDPQEAARRFFNDFRSYSGILMERGPGQYGFMHLTIEEYLAAIHLANCINEGADKVSGLIIEHINEQPWYEVSLLAIGHLALKATALKPFAAQVVDKLLADASENHGKAKVQVGQTVFEAGEDGFSADTIEHVRGCLLRAMSDTTIMTTVRCDTGDVVANLGDPRPEVLDSQHMALCKIPPGDFWLGDGKEDDCPQALCKELDYDYWLSKYPVTVSQFRQFVDAGSYQQERYWPEAKQAKFWKAGQVKYWLEEDWHVGTPELPSRFDCDNHPMVMVSWYEALAYCRWLTEFLHKGEVVSKELADLDHQDWNVTLPSEAEWEKAARGYEQERVYPCGDKLSSDLVNYRETKIGATSAVGCFPRDESPCGCLDMTGNVWEWCRNTRESYPYKLDDRDRVDMNTGSIRVIRGGCWGNSAEFCRCSYRSRDFPDYRDGGLGFRVVLVPSSLSSSK